MKAVVVGGGIAGLLAARVLSESHDVVVLERDRLSDEPEFRGGVPQARHVHGLLVRGGEIMEGLFPGLRDELVAAGAFLVDAGEVRLLQPLGWVAETETGLPLLVVSRPLLETRIRRRVTTKIIDDVQVTGLSYNGSTVDGVVTGDGRHSADLVVDASGRFSKLRNWLAEAGIVTPEPEVVDSRTAYASRIYRAPEGFPVAVSETVAAPYVRRGCLAMRIEGDRLMVSAQGAKGDHPPKDPEGFQAFLESLKGPIAGMIEDAEPLTPVHLFTKMPSVRNAFEDSANWPGGLVAIGDVVCAFNPVYGQGMTVAAIQALLLRQQDFSAKSCRRFQKRVAKVTRGAWLLSADADRGWVDGGHAPGPFKRAYGWYLRFWYFGIIHDPELVKRFFRVVHMVSTPASLLNPSMIRRLARYSKRGRRRARRHAGANPR